MTDQHQDPIARIYYLNDQKRTPGMLSGGLTRGQDQDAGNISRRHGQNERLPAIIVGDAIPTANCPWRGTFCAV
jgi:hypothetical protein